LELSASHALRKLADALGEEAVTYDGGFTFVYPEHEVGFVSQNSEARVLSLVRS
jgi:hypothetical protein